MKKAVRILLASGIVASGLFLLQQSNAPLAMSDSAKVCSLCVVKVNGGMTCDGVEWEAAGCYKQECRCMRTVHESPSGE